MYLAHFNSNILSTHLSKENHNVIFIDYNSNMSATFMEKEVLNILSIYREHNKNVMLKTVIDSIITFLTRNKNSEIVVHIESGSSQYHLNINKDYKTRRGEYLLLTQDDLDTFYNVYSTSKQIIELLSIKIPRLKVVSFKYMEADIVPFLSSEYYDNNTHMYMCSSDKDLFQCLYDDRFVFQLRQIPTIKDNLKRVVTNSSCIYSICNRNPESIPSDMRPLLVPFLLSIAGDSSDNIKGLEKVGYLTVLSEFEKIKDKIDKDMFSNYSTITELQDIYDKVIIPNFRINISKKISDNIETILNNHKLIDFKIMRTYIDLSFKNQVKEVLGTTKEEYWSEQDFIDILKELIWYETDWLIKMKEKYSSLLY